MSTHRGGCPYGNALQAAVMENAEIVRVLLKHRADANAGGHPHGGDNALGLAIHFRKFSIAKILRASGAIAVAPVNDIEVIDLTV